ELTMRNSPPPRSRRTWRVSIGLLCAAAVLSGAQFAHSQEPSTPQTVSPAGLQAAIDNLGKLDYEIRTAASRTSRRTPVNQAVPALVNAVRTHQDGYVKYRALVLLTGFNDPGTETVMREALTDVNDRLRTVAYQFFEHHPDRTMTQGLIAAL